VLTHHEVRIRLDALANEVLQAPGLYDELFSRLFSERVHNWIRTVPENEAILIRGIAERDPDYSSNIEIIVAAATQQEPLFNPAWDVDY
jgi:hypothetical protein